MPKVSVIIPVYNTEDYLRKCLDSVCNQTLSDIEIICINDCSTDSSLEILKEYSSNDNRIKLINFDKNKGAAVARNTGIDIAQGEYIGFIDSDDFIDLDFYEKLYNKAIETSADVVKGQIKKDNNDNSFYNIDSKIKKHKSYFCYMFTTSIYKSEFLKNNHICFPKELKHFEDPCFLIHAMLICNNIEIINNTYYYYVENKSSITQNITEAKIKDIINGSIYILELLKQYHVDIKHYIIVFNFIFNQLLFCANNIKFSDNINKIAAEGIYYIYDKCKYPKEFINYHFVQKKEDAKQQIIANLRNNLKREVIYAKS